MSWNKVKQPFKKSLRWWYHKVLCEFFYGRSTSQYQKHLNKLCALGWNLYGEVWQPVKPKYGFDLLADFDKIIAQQDALKKQNPPRLTPHFPFPYSSYMVEYADLIEKLRVESERKKWMDEVHVMD